MKKVNAKNHQTKHRGSIESAKRSEKRFAYMLLIPFILGFLLFFIQPFLKSLIFSFNNVNLLSESEKYTFVGFKYYNQSLFSDVEFRAVLISGIKELVLKVPMILFFSLFVATLLNKEFKGKTVSRVVLFLPVIITTGVLLAVESGDYLISSAGVGADTALNSGVYTVDTFNLQQLLLSLKLPQELMDYISKVIGQFYSILVSSGVQITILLAALQSISPSLYEASAIEGATAWENFWKITLPMSSSYIFVCALYTIIDTFTNPTNGVINYISGTNFSTINYGLTSAMSWIYFLIIAAILGLVSLLFLGSKFVVYQDK